MTTDLRRTLHAAAAAANAVDPLKCDDTHWMSHVFVFPPQANRKEFESEFLAACGEAGVDCRKGTHKKRACFVLSFNPGDNTLLSLQTQELLAQAEQVLDVLKAETPLHLHHQIRWVDVARAMISRGASSLPEDRLSAALDEAFNTDDGRGASAWMLADAAGAKALASAGLEVSHWTRLD